jgi:hypothetical protein
MLEANLSCEALLFSKAQTTHLLRLQMTHASLALVAGGFGGHFKNSNTNATPTQGCPLIAHQAIERNEKRTRDYSLQVLCWFKVSEMLIEPTHSNGHWILNPLKATFGGVGVVFLSCCMSFAAREKRQFTR